MLFQQHLHLGTRTAVHTLAPLLLLRQLCQNRQHAQQLSSRLPRRPYRLTSPTYRRYQLRLSRRGIFPRAIDPNPLEMLGLRNRLKLLHLYQAWPTRPPGSRHISPYGNSSTYPSCSSCSFYSACSFAESSSGLPTCYRT
jgi:hypothetical protein